MTKADLIEEVSRVVEIPRREAELVFETMLRSMVQALRAGDKVEIRGFGRFDTRQRAGRIGRNPKSGQAVEVLGCSHRCLSLSQHSTRENPVGRIAGKDQGVGKIR